MKVQYFNPRIEVLLCRRRVATEWPRIRRLKDPFWRFYWHPKEPAGIIFQNRRWALEPGMFALIAPDTKFEPVMPDAVEQFYLHFTCGYPYDRMPAGVFCQPLMPGMFSLLGRISVLLKKEEACPSRRLSFLTHSLGAMALGGLDDLNVVPADVDARIEKVIDDANADFGVAVNNARLARKAGLAEKAFIRLFSRKTGISPQRYFRERRIREACVMLRYSSETIDEIAARCGFADRCHFSRVFKQLRRISPAAFRHAGREDA